MKVSLIKGENDFTLKVSEIPTRIQVDLLLDRLKGKPETTDVEIILFSEFLGDNYNRSRKGWMNKINMEKGLYVSEKTVELLKKFRNKKFTSNELL